MAGALGYQASEEDLRHLITWFAVAAGVTAAWAYVTSPEPLSKNQAKGALDRFRTAGAYSIAALVLMFAYVYSNDPMEAIPPLRTKASLWLFAVFNAGSCACFANMNATEAATPLPENFKLRLFWILQFVAWGAAAVARGDPEASDHDLADAWTGAGWAFWTLAALVGSVGASYVLFAEAARYQQRAPAATVGDGEEEEETTPPHPEIMAGPLSLAYFMWMTPLVKLGYSRPLEQSDLNHIHPSDDPVHLNGLFQKSWGDELRLLDSGKKPSLTRALVKAYGWDYLVGSFAKLVYDCSQFVGPLLLQRIIEFLTERQNTNNAEDGGKAPPRRYGYELVFLLFLNAVGQSVILHQYFHRAMRTGMRLKAALVAAIYDKALRVKPGSAAAVIPKKNSGKDSNTPKVVAAASSSSSSSAKSKYSGGNAFAATSKDIELAKTTSKKEEKTSSSPPPAPEQQHKTTTGEVVNLMAVDAQKIQDTMSYIAMLWSGVLQIALSLWYLFSLLGPAVFGGLFIMGISVPLTARISIKSRALMKVVMKVKDERIKVENEVLGGMKIIKLYAWEKPFTSKILSIRDQELLALWKYKALNIASRVFFSAVPITVSIASFALYTALGNTLTPAVAFTALSLFNILRFPLMMLPMALAATIEAELSMSRISAFLLAPEVKMLAGLKKQSSSSSKGGGALLTLSLGGSEVEGDWWAVGRPLPVARMRATSAAEDNGAKRPDGGVVPSVRMELVSSTSKEQASRKAEKVKPTEVKDAFALDDEERVKEEEAGFVDPHDPAYNNNNNRKDGSDEVFMNVFGGGGDPEEVQQQPESSSSSISSASKPQDDDPLKLDVIGASDQIVKGLKRGPLRLLLDNACLEWDLDVPLLSDVSFTLREGELCMVVGSTGSGKSGLLSAVIGEIEASSGVLKSRGSIAYVSQVPWIQNATLKANILFGQAYDKARYDAVVEACALTADLKQLPGGELTEIGEKGINLSGGQKQRVAIARAVYSNADIYLLDDCLSAVDSQVSQHIFNQCLRHPSMLLRKAVLLVSHNLQLLPQADKVVLLDNKAAKFVGPYSEFLELNHDLARSANGHRQQSEGGGGGMVDFDMTYVNPFGIDPASLGMAQEEGAKGGRGGLGMSGFHKDDEEDNENAAAGHQLKKKTDVLIQKEALERGSVPFQTYWRYITASGAAATLGGVIGGQVMYNAAAGVTNWWLGYWADRAAGAKEDRVDGEEQVGGAQGLGIFALLSFATVLASTLSVFASTYTGQRSAKVFHEVLISAVVRAPMSFYDTTPLGRIVNRFSKDTQTIDERLPATLYMWLSTLFNVVVAVGVITYVTPFFLLACVPMGFVYRQVMLVYIPTSRELQRLESVTRSPIFSQFGETLEGVSTIRAFRAEDQFFAAIMDKVERNLRSYYANVSSNRWLALRLEAIGNVFVVFAAVLAVMGAGSVSGGSGGLALTYSLSITQTLNWYVRQSAELESQVVSVERIKEYADVTPEAPAVVEGRRPPKAWPEKGGIEFHKTAMRYRPGLPLVLKGDQDQGLVCSIPGGQKVGVVGRTGAGKSSLLLVLLRLVEPEPGGTLVVDGHDVLKMGLDDLRSRVSIIPQDPVLFTGTVRFNLDPFGDHGDDAVWSAMDRAHLGEHIRSLPDGLEAEVEEGGRNFSMGERQLLCLARALLRASRILLLDEATSAVDHHTDALVQGTIRKEFKDCTVLTIAHRLDTIIDYDRVLVLSDGKVAEDDHPKSLIDSDKYPEGLFKSMWEAHQHGEA